MILILFLCWIIFNGKITLEIALVGAFITALVYAFMWKFLSWNIKKDFYIARLMGFILSYFVTLIVEIIKATLATIAITFDERIENTPVVVDFDVDIKTEILKVVLANSITLTPGTITVSLTGNHYVVHALDDSFAVDIDKSVFVEKLMRADELFNKIRG